MYNRTRWIGDVWSTCSPPLSLFLSSSPTTSFLHLRPKVFSSSAEQERRTLLCLFSQKRATRSNGNREGRDFCIPAGRCFETLFSSLPHSLPLLSFLSLRFVWRTTTPYIVADFLKGKKTKENTERKRAQLTNNKQREEMNERTKRDAFSQSESRMWHNSQVQRRDTHALCVFTSTPYDALPTPLPHANLYELKSGSGGWGGYMILIHSAHLHVCLCVPLYNALFTFAPIEWPLLEQTTNNPCLFFILTSYSALWTPAYKTQTKMSTLNPSQMAFIYHFHPCYRFIVLFIDCTNTHFLGIKLGLIPSLVFFSPSDTATCPFYARPYRSRSVVVQEIMYHCTIPYIQQMTRLTNGSCPIRFLLCCRCH